MKEHTPLIRNNLQNKVKYYVKSNKIVTEDFKVPLAIRILEQYVVV